VSNASLTHEKAYHEKQQILLLLAVRYRVPCKTILLQLSKNISQREYLAGNGPKNGCVNLWKLFYRTRSNSQQPGKD